MCLLVFLSTQLKSKTPIINSLSLSPPLSLSLSLIDKMFGHNGFGEVPYHEYPLLDATTTATQPTLIIPPPPLLAIPGSYTSSGCSSYGGSPTSITSYGGPYSPTSLIQRSTSSHSLHKNLEELYSPQGYHFEPEACSSHVRKVLSTGDLQGVNLAQYNQRSSNTSPLGSSIIESMNRAASPYSPEEKKERIERYRSKRNLRNFNKKIKYECRKTLADSRPRIRGRFARNDEIDKTTPQWDHIIHDANHVEEDDELDNMDDDNWINFIDAFSANLMP